MAYGPHHVLALNHLLDSRLEFEILDQGLARRRELSLDRLELLAQHFEEPRARAEDLEIALDLLDDVAELAGDLVALEASEALEPQVEDGLGLLLGEAIGAVGLRAATPRLLDEGDERRPRLRRPQPPHQCRTRRRGVGRRTDELDHRIDIGDGDGEPEQQMRALARLAEQEHGAPGDHLLAEGDEGGEDVAQAHQLRPAAVECQHVDAEAGLQRRMAEELVQHDVGRSVALQLDDDAHALAVALVAQVGDALDQLLAHAFGDALDHARLVDLIGNLGDDDGFALLAQLLDMSAAAHDHRAAAELVGGLDADATEDDAAGREVRPGDELHQLVGGDG